MDRWLNSCFAGPIGQFDDTMEVVGHDGERVNLDMSIMSRNAMPVCMRNPSVRVHDHPAIRDLPEPWMAILCAERHEIQAGQCVIVGAFPDAEAMVTSGVECVRAVHDAENT